MTDYPKCIWALPRPCSEEVVYDGLCAVHNEYMEMASAFQKELYNLIRSLIAHQEHADRITERIVGDLVGPLLDRLAAREIANQDGYANRWRRTARLAIKARRDEARLRSDFGELAKDLKKTINLLTARLGGDTDPAMEDLHSWRATAEILADKGLSDNLDQIRKAPIEDFGEVPRPEWRCHIHPNLEPTQRFNGTKICSDGMCIQGEGD
jgi:hypothetical protein